MSVGVGILVVEDNAANRKMMRVALEAEGYDVSEAADGQTALKLAAERRFRLLILDCRLPDFDAFDLAPKLASLAPGVPMLAVTGWVQADESRLHVAGFQEILVKPVDPSRLVEVVARYARPEGRGPASHAGRLLVVDDDATSRKLARLALVDAGFDVVTAEGGLEAIAIARRERVDAVVTDVMMPEIDGFALCSLIRSDPALSSLPIVLMSAHYVEDADRILAKRFGASGYVSRTGGFDSVVQAVASALESRRSLVPSNPSEDLKAEHMRRLAHQLERQARLGAGHARRASLHATALSVLSGVSDALARQIDPEAALSDTLSLCVDAVGLSVGAILLRSPSGELVEKALQGISGVDWSPHMELFARVTADGSFYAPSAAAGEGGERLLAALRAGSALVVPILARDEVLGILLLASSRADLAEAEGDSFARAARSVSMQLGQALALSRAFTRLSETEQRYRLLFDNANDAISILATDGKVLQANKRWEEILRQPRDQIVGRTIADFAPESERGAREHDFAEDVEKGTASRELSIRRGDGSVAQLEVRRALIDVGGERLVLAIARDMTERVALTEQLRHAQKMEAVGRLAGGVAHDMNNMLTVVLTYAHFLADGLAEGDPRRDDVSEIETAAQRGAALTRQLLAFSRQQVLQPTVLDLNDVLRNVLKMVRTLIGEDIAVHEELAAGPVRVKVDAGQIEQIVLNLAVNARDAMPNGGRLTIATEVGERALLRVTDTGTGMEEATRERIFEPFFTTKGPGKGTGLGLAMVFGIVKQSQGDIHVQTQLGRGTSFVIDVPFATEATPARRASPRGARERAHDETILLVEDNAPLRSAIVRGLGARGYRVLPAGTGPEAVALWEAHASEIRLVVTDVVLPGLSGGDVARRIRESRPDMKVLFMSGYTDTTNHKDVPIGGPSFVQKPFTPDALAARVEALLDE